MGLISPVAFFVHIFLHLSPYDAILSVLRLSGKEREVRCGFGFLVWKNSLLCNSKDVNSM